LRKDWAIRWGCQPKHVVVRNGDKFEPPCEFLFFPGLPSPFRFLTTAVTDLAKSIEVTPHRQSDTWVPSRELVWNSPRPHLQRLCLREDLQFRLRCPTPLARLTDVTLFGASRETMQMFAMPTLE
jgi:hypothetical protein